VEAHSLNNIREADVPVFVPGARTLRKARRALAQVEVTPVLRGYLAEAARIKSVRSADAVSLNVAIIVVAAWNAYKRVHGQATAH
jgi:hypothetical protein